MILTKGVYIYLSEKQCLKIILSNKLAKISTLADLNLLPPRNRSCLAWANCLHITTILALGNIQRAALLALQPSSLVYNLPSFCNLLESFLILQEEGKGFILVDILVKRYLRLISPFFFK